MSLDQPTWMNVRNCVCGLRPRLNDTHTNQLHPDMFTLILGGILHAGATVLLYRIEPLWAGIPAGLFIFAVVTAAVVKHARGHTGWCAVRDAVLIGIALPASIASFFHTNV